VRLIQTFDTKLQMTRHLDTNFDTTRRNDTKAMLNSSDGRLARHVLPKQ